MDITLNSYLLFWVCIVGLCLGSFYNVVILRSLNNESLVFPPSKCPKCENRLKPWHNIPVFSYIFLRGKCAFCGEKISLQYPIIELLTMGLFIACYLKFGISYQTLFGFCLCSTLLIMTVTDLKERLVDCNIAIGLAVIGLLYNWLVNGALVDSILGLIVGVILLEAVAGMGYLINKSRAMGEADTYVAGALGACFGLQGLLMTLLYTLIFSMVFILPLFLYKQYKNNNKLTCILFILFTLSVLCFKTLQQSYLTLALVLIFGVLLVIEVLKSLKKDADLTYLPFVPAFALGALYYFFF